MTQEIEIIIDEPISLTMGAQQALPDSVVLDENYVHTDNNYTDEDKQKVAQALTSETDPTVPAHVKSITETDISNWNTPSHSHANKTLLDSYTQTETNLADAVSKKHSHANKTELDSITAIKIVEWNAALQAEDLQGLASENYVDTKVAGIVESAPETLNTLNELAAALGDDPNFATSIATQLGQKANTADLGSAAFTPIENYIKNQTATDQAGGFRISGNGRVGGTFGIGGDPGGTALAVDKNISSTTAPPTGNWQLLTYAALLTSSKSTYTQTGHVNGNFAFSSEDYTIQNDGLGNNVYGHGKLIKLTTQGSSGTTDLYGERLMVTDNSETTQNTWLYGISTTVTRNTAHKPIYTAGLRFTAQLSPTVPITMTGSTLAGIDATATVEMQTTGYGVPATVNLTDLNGVNVNATARIHPSDTVRFANITNINGIIITAGAANNPNVVVQNTYGIRILNGYANNLATITNHYGLYIDDTSMGDVKNYNIWSGGTGLNYLSGKTGIGVENPVEKLEVAGNVKADSIILPEGFEIRAGEYSGGLLTIGRHIEGGQVFPDNSSPYIGLLNDEVYIRGSVDPNTGKMASVYINNSRVPSWNDLLYSFVSYPDEVWYDWWDTVYFDRNMQYYSPDSPGNFTEILPIVDDPQNPQQNWRTATIYHQAANEPTYPTYWKKLGSSLPYNSAKVNIIHARYFDGKVLFRIDHII